MTIPSGSSFTLPYANSVNSASTLFDITNTGSGASGLFNIANTANTTNALTGITNGTGYGIYGYNNNGTGNNRIGVFGAYNTASYGYGLVGLGWQGIAPGTGNADVGVYGSANTAGVLASSTSGYGLYASSTEDIGLNGESGATGNMLTSMSEAGTPGGYFYGAGGQALYAFTIGFDTYGGNTASKAVTGVSVPTGAAFGLGGYFVGADGYTAGTGVEAQGNGYSGWSQYVTGIVASTAGTGSVSTRAGVFIGDVDVTGSLSKGGGTFKIDHPLDPQNKYLYHSFVESPDMMNIYNGNVTTDQDGNALVELPSYFDALNKDFRYQLTVIGQFAQAIVSEEISGNSFRIKSDKPNVKVSWQVTGVRNDAWANANRVQPEVVKPGPEKGRYLHPELFGQSADKGVSALNVSGGLKPESLRSLTKKTLPEGRGEKK